MKRVTIALLAVAALMFPVGVFDGATLAQVLTPEDDAPRGWAEPRPSQSGYTAAVYLLQRSLGIPGSITVYAEESTSDLPEGVDDVALEVTFEIRNGSTETIEFRPDDLGLDLWSRRGRSQSGLNPVAVSGTTKIRPRSAESIRAYFAFDEVAGFERDQVDSIRVHWGFRPRLSTRIVQYTVFAVDRTGAEARYIFTPQYDPFMRPPIGRTLFDVSQKSFRLRQLPKFGPLPDGSPAR
jgi:hypothetical protein